MQPACSRRHIAPAGIGSNEATPVLFGIRIWAALLGHDVGDPGGKWRHAVWGTYPMPVGHTFAFPGLPRAPVVPGRRAGFTPGTRELQEHLLARIALSSGPGQGAVPRPGEAAACGTYFRRGDAVLHMPRTRREDAEDNTDNTPYRPSGDGGMVINRQQTIFNTNTVS